MKPIVALLSAITVLSNSAAAEHKPVDWTRNAFPLPESIWSVEALDANGDGKLDLIAMGETKVFALMGPDWKQSVLADTQEPKLLYCVDRRCQSRWRRRFDRRQHPGTILPEKPRMVRDPARGQNTFKRHSITKGEADGRPHYLDFADLNGDGRGDVLLGDSGGGTFTWWENPKNRDAAWVKHEIAKEKGATNIKAADANDDGKLDVVASCGHGKGVFWFEAPNWTKHEIQAGLADPHALAIGDFDGDNDLDVAAASFTAFVVRWYQNDGKGVFTAHDIDTGNKQQAYDLKAADLDRDTRTDLILAGRETRNAVWYQNRSR